MVKRNKGDDFMATSTFDKAIYIDDNAADRLIEVLKKPVTKIDDNNDDVFERSANALKWLLSNSKTSSTLNKK